PGPGPGQRGGAGPLGGGAGHGGSAGARHPDGRGGGGASPGRDEPGGPGGQPALAAGSGTLAPLAGPLHQPDPAPKRLGEQCRRGGGRPGGGPPALGRTPEPRGAPLPGLGVGRPRRQRSARAGGGPDGGPAPTADGPSRPA